MYGSPNDPFQHQPLQQQQQQMQPPRASNIKYEPPVHTMKTFYDERAIGEKELLDEFLCHLQKTKQRGREAHGTNLNFNGRSVANWSTEQAVDEFVQNFHDQAVVGMVPDSSRQFVEVEECETVHEVGGERVRSELNRDKTTRSISQKS